MIYFENAQLAFNHYYDKIKDYGNDFRDTKALFNESFTLEYPNLNEIYTKERKWSKDYAENEWLWYLKGERSVSELKLRAPIWDKMHRGDDLVWSNYGYWWKRNDQLDKMVALLKRDPHTRRAVLLHYDVDSVDEFVKDTPCNLVLNFFILEGALQLTVFARSIDLWYGFCNDQYCFSKLMELVAEELNLTVGFMTFHITNFHLYNNKIKEQ